MGVTVNNHGNVRRIAARVGELESDGSPFVPPDWVRSHAKWRAALLAELIDRQSNGCAAWRKRWCPPVKQELLQLLRSGR